MPDFLFLARDGSHRASLIMIRDAPDALRAQQTAERVVMEEGLPAKAFHVIPVRDLYDLDNHVYMQDAPPDRMAEQILYRPRR